MSDPGDPAAENKIPTIESVLRDGARRLAVAQIAQPGLDARLLLGNVLGLDQSAMILAGYRQVGALDIERFAQVLSRRAGGEPVSRIIGVREFYSRQFTLAPAVLDPRPDSECLVEAALKLAGEPTHILDLGTGSGCLLVTLLAELPGATGVGVDISPDALVVARRNAQRHGVAGRAGFVVGNWCAGLDTTFDMIVANPPYIESDAIDALTPEVRDFDPRQALDGGGDGLECIRALARGAARVLGPGGMMLVEIGHTQAVAALGILAEHGFGPLAGSGISTDLGGRDRVLTVGKK